MMRIIESIVVVDIIVKTVLYRELNGSKKNLVALARPSPVPLS